MEARKQRNTTHHKQQTIFLFQISPILPFFIFTSLAAFQRVGKRVDPRRMVGGGVDSRIKHF